MCSFFTFHLLASESLPLKEAMSSAGFVAFQVEITPLLRELHTASFGPILVRVARLV